MSTVLDNGPEADVPVTQPLPPGRAPLRRLALRGYAPVVAAVVLVLIGCAAAAGLSGQARHQLALSFTKQPTRYVELYFAGNPTAALTWERGQHLGAAFGNAQAVVSVSFTVANHDEPTATFPYEVEVFGEARSTLARADGSVSAADGATQTTTLSLPLPAAREWSAVEVRLAGRDERIRFRRAG